MSENSRILPYLDIPFQHVSDHILRLMNRPSTKAHLTGLMKTVRRILPLAALRTTMMVGFPGETEDDIAEMTDFLQEHHFDHLGVFAYANEEGCKASTFPEQVAEETKEERLKEMVVTFGIKIAEKEKNPHVTEKELVQAVEKKQTELAGPQKDGFGLDQAGIDDLLASI